MLENLKEIVRQAIDPISHAINNKVASFTAASGLFTAGVVAENSAAPSIRNINEIPITEIFTFVPTIPVASMYLGGAWMIVCLAKELYKLMKNIWLWCRGRNVLFSRKAGRQER